MIEAKINNKSFVEWAKAVQEGVRKMDSTLYEAGLKIDEATEEFIPIDWAYLVRSYEASIFSTYPKIELKYGYTGRHSPRYDGFDYAWVQWEVEDFHHTHGGPHFIEKGIAASSDAVFELIEKDYLSCFGVKI